MKRNFLLFVSAFCFAAAAYAQPVGNVYVLNEGAFGGANGSIGYLNFDNGMGTYTHIDSVSQFGNQILFWNQSLYVVDGEGNVLIYPYDLGTGFGEPDTLPMLGARNVQIYPDAGGAQLLVAGTQVPYFRSFDVDQNYAPLYSLDATKLAVCVRKFWWWETRLMFLDFLMTRCWQLWICRRRIPYLQLRLPRTTIS